MLATNAPFFVSNGPFTTTNDPFIATNGAFFTSSGPFTTTNGAFIAGNGAFIVSSVVFFAVRAPLLVTRSPLLAKRGDGRSFAPWALGGCEWLQPLGAGPLVSLGPLGRRTGLARHGVGPRGREAKAHAVEWLKPLATTERPGGGARERDPRARGVGTIAGRQRRRRGGQVDC